MKRFRKLVSIWGDLFLSCSFFYRPSFLQCFKADMLVGQFFTQSYRLYSIRFHCFHIRFELSRPNELFEPPSVENGGKLVVSLTIKRDFPFPLLYTVISEKWRDEEILLVTKEVLLKNFLFLVFKRKKSGSTR